MMFPVVIGSNAAKRRRARHVFTACALLGSALLFSVPMYSQQGGQTHGMTIPTGHPRLWFNTERLAQARQWYQANPFTPASDHMVDNALAGLLANNATYCRTATNLALNTIITEADLESSSSNDARWFGEHVYLTYDWCYNHMSATERDTLMSRWNRYNDILRQKAWGGPTMNANNYHWGYLRNELAWGITSYGENTMAETFLQDALVTRWQNNFVPYAAGIGAGGVATEGSQYGPYLLGYSSVPFQTVENFGRPIYDETNFYKAAVFGLIYGMTPGPSSHRGSTLQGYEMFPYSDDQFWRHGASANNYDYGTFMTVASMRWGNTAVGRYARQWLNTVQPTRHRYVRSIDTGGTAQGFESLPLDYYAPGPGRLFTKSSWGANATNVHLMLGDDMPATGHTQDDWGFQIWRGGRWLSRETTAYAEYIAGYAGGSRVDVISPLAHNGIMINGTHVAPNDYAQGPAQVTRLHSATNFSHVATNLTPAYRAVNRPQNDNPAVANIVREFLFIRPMETLVILDRLASNAVGTTAAANVPKTFLTHFEYPPQITSPGYVLGVNGNQALRLITLVPSNATYRVIDEASNGGTAVIAQHRLEVETSGQVQSYFLHVLQARDANASDIVASVSEDASTFRVSLTHPTAGLATVVFGKGMASTGGSIAFGSGSPISFNTGVQRIQVTDNGPVWDSALGSGPASPTGLRILP